MITSVYSGGKHLYYFALLVLWSSCGTSSDATTLQEGPSLRDDSVRQILEEVYDSDQGVREQFYTGQPITGEMFYEMHVVDSINWQRTEALLSSYGFPKKSRVGEKASEAGFYIVQHRDSALMEAYVDTLEAFAAIGEAKLTNAALMRDRVLMNRNEKQIYGTQASPQLNPTYPDSLYIWPIAEPDSVNARRQQAGFESTVEENAERLNSMYDPNLELPEAVIK